jgi:hypothetical protein
MKFCLVFSLSLVLSFNLNAQSAEDSVKMAVNKLFEAMKSGDAVLLKSAFADSAILQTIARNKDGNVIVQTEEIAGFIESISKLPKGAADERIVFDGIKIDGPLAIVWAPYKFYFNGNFSHCGVNSFQLIKINNEWKIQYIIDTRRRTGCE